MGFKPSVSAFFRHFSLTVGLISAKLWHNKFLMTYVIFTNMVCSENIQTKGTRHRLVMVRIDRRTWGRDRDYYDVGKWSAVALQLFAAQFRSSANPTTADRPITA